MKKLYSYLLSTFIKEKRSYSFQETKEAIIERLQKQFEEAENTLSFNDIEGKFINRNIFTIKFKPLLFLIQPTILRTRLKGYISFLDINKTLIEIEVKPPIYPFLIVIIFSVFGILYIYHYITTEDSLEFLFYGIGLIFIGIPISMWISVIIKTTILDRFENLLKV